MTQTCEKKIENQTVCTEAGIYGVPDPDGKLHYFCGTHLWDQLPATEEEKRSKTCQMLGANPPSLEACGRPAAFKHVGPFGETKYWCTRCRRKHFPTEAEKAQDEEAERKEAELFRALSTYLWTPLGWLFKLFAVAVAIYGLVAFIHWCWKNS